MGQGYTGGLGSRGGKNYWYDAMQSLQPYRSGFREQEGEVAESGILGKSRRLDSETKQIIENLKLQQLENKYEEEDLAQQTKIQKTALGKQKAGNVGTAAFTGVKLLGSEKVKNAMFRMAVKGAYRTGLGSGASGLIGNAGLSLMGIPGLQPLMFAFGAAKWAQSMGLLDKNLFKPRKWRF